MREADEPAGKPDKEAPRSYHTNSHGRSPREPSPSGGGWFSRSGL